MRAVWLSVMLTLVVVAGSGGCAHDTNWLFNTAYEIIAVDVDAGTFTVGGDIRASMVRPPDPESEDEEEGERFYDIEVDNSMLNDGTYAVTAVEVIDGNTVITVEETIRDATVDGHIVLVPPEGTAIDPSQVQLYFRTVGAFESDVWYYMVFNFSKAPEFSNQVVPDDGWPFDQISNQDRARNWELYVMLHTTGQGNEELFALQRSRLPSLLEAARGPVDAATGYFDEGPILAEGTDVPNTHLLDIAVACRLDGIVQLTRSIFPDLDDPLYFDPPVDIAASAGLGPMRLHAAEFTGDSSLDLLVLYEGDEAGGSVRVLAGNGAGGFTASGGDLALAGTPIDWLVTDFNGDTRQDFAVLVTDGEAGEVLTFLWEAVAEPPEGEPAYTFSAGPVLMAGDDPVAIAGGSLEGTSTDLVVANGGTVEDGGDLRVFTGGGDGSFAAGPTLAVGGQVMGVAVGTMISTQDDIVVTYQGMVDETVGEETNQVQRGHVQLFRNLQEAELAFDNSPSGIVYFDGDPRHVLIHNTGQEAGSQPSAVIVDGRLSVTEPGTANQTMYILRSDRSGGQFVWNTEIINYLTAGAEPTRISLADFDGDGIANDFVIPSSVDDASGNSVNVFIGLGKHNYTDADIYWTDDAPEALTVQEWYLGYTVGPNYFELFVDPELFYDLTRLPPKSFIVDFMTGTSPLEYVRNLDQLGEIREHLSSPVVVPIVLDHFDNEQLNPRALEHVTDDAANIDFWKNEVF